MPQTPETLESLRARFDALARPFDVHPSYKQFATSPTDNGGSHVEHYGTTYAYVITERGNEYERRETADPDELLYWLVSDTTRQAAQQFELRHRVHGEDSRRQLFARHVELLAGIRPEWATRKRGEYAKVLEKHPYNDRA